MTLSCRSVATPPPRARGVPIDAVWAGGVDGGAWILCKAVESRNYCSVYNDHTGNIWARGYFLLRGEKRGVSERELTYNSFDGESIHLTDGRSLIPVSGEVDFPKK